MYRKAHTGQDLTSMKGEMLNYLERLERDFFSLLRKKEGIKSSFILLCFNRDYSE